MSTGRETTAYPKHYRLEQFEAIRDKREFRNCDDFSKFRIQLVKNGTALSTSPGVVT